MKTRFYNLNKVLPILVFGLMLNFTSVAQLNYGFVLDQTSATTSKFMTFVPKGYTYNGTNYVTGCLTLSSYLNVTTQNYVDYGYPVQKLQLQGGNILLLSTNSGPTGPIINPTSKNGAILFGDEVNEYKGYIHGNWGIEYDNQYSTGGLNFFKPKSSLTETRINYNLFIRNDGNIGIGTGAPVAKLQIADGDIYIQDINKGIIMKSPDGNCWRGTMNNQGQLQFVQLAECVVLAENKPVETAVSLIAFPNPTTNSITVDLQKFENKNVILRVINQAGQQMVEKSIVAKNNYSLDVSSLATGAYMLYVNCSNLNETIKFVKQ